MKPEFPLIYSKASTIIAAPLILVILSFYVTYAIQLPAKDILPMAITVLGITLALSGICFSMAPTDKEEPTVRYSGEKFLHSSLLLIQTIIIIFAKDALNTIPFINTQNVLKIIITLILQGLLILISTVAAITWFWGLVELNKELWKKWEMRIKKIRETTEKGKKRKDEKTKQE